MAVVNSSLTPIPVRWRFPQETEDDDGSLERDSLGSGEFDSLKLNPTYKPPQLSNEDVSDAWAPQRCVDSSNGQSFEMEQFSYGSRDSRFDILKQNTHSFQEQCHNRGDDSRYRGGGSTFIHPAIFDQEKWEKHKRLIKEYFEAQQQRLECLRAADDWDNFDDAPDWEPYRRQVLNPSMPPKSSSPEADQLHGPHGGLWSDVLPPIREQPGEMADGELEEEGKREDEEDQKEEKRISPSLESRDLRPESRASSASPASSRGGRPTLQLVGVTLDSSSCDDASVDSGRGPSAGRASPPPPPRAASSPSSTSSTSSSAAALRIHRKELSMDSGIQGSQCDLAAGDASDAGADAGEDLPAATAAAGRSPSREAAGFSPAQEGELLHGETFNLVEEVYVVGNPLADKAAVAAAAPPPPPAVAAPAPDAAPAPAHQTRHVVVVAIDFGTTYSGYAFCFTRDPELNVHMMRKWEGGDPGLNNQKTPTTLLLTPDERFHSFGFAARDFFHDLDPLEARRWLFFDKFKMALHHDQDMSRETRVQAANGACVPALTVFAHALRHLKEQALRELSDQAAAELRPSHIRWVVTVPAIWRQPAKQFIREAAYQAGICEPDRPEGLLIALEPEAASICCRKLRLNQLVAEPRPALPLPPPPPAHACAHAHDAPGLVLSDPPAGMRYMVVDCGGGTVDITVHELSAQGGTLRELHKATGGPWGSMGVDAEFERLLGAIFGAELVAQFRAQRPASYTELMVSWEARKRSASPQRDAPLSVFPPFAFIDFFRKQRGKEIEQAVRKYGSKEVTWSSQGALRLQPSLMRQLFQPTIHKILRYIQDVLDSPRVHGIQYLFLVGGFAESQLLQHEVRTAFSTRVRVVIPQGVALTTLRGAVLYGLEPSVVAVRRAKHTYGVGVLKRFVHGVHPAEKLVERDGVQWCADVLDKFVSAEQAVAVGEAVLRRYTPALPSQSAILINIYCADDDDAQYTTDPGVRRCGALRLNLSAPGGSGDVDAIVSDDAPPRPREIHARMVFGGTEITATALDLASGCCVHAEVDFLTL